LQEGVPLKILKDFKPEAEFVLNPGDMLYLPPGYAHDGIAMDECMTYSIGFRVPGQSELASELLLGLSEEFEEQVGADKDALYQDPDQAAAIHDAEIPLALQKFAADALSKALKNPNLLHCLLGESLTQPKSNVWFDNPNLDQLDELVWPCGIKLDRRTKMLFDRHHIFINGESFKATGTDARVLKKLAKDKVLSKAWAAKLSSGASELMRSWWEEGWWHPV
jgi:50S ribosomal protein L16 3-hydroxylase